MIKIYPVSVEMLALSIFIFILNLVFIFLILKKGYFFQRIETKRDLIRRTQNILFLNIYLFFIGLPSFLIPIWNFFQNKSIFFNVLSRVIPLMIIIFTLLLWRVSLFSFKLKFWRRFIFTFFYMLVIFAVLSIPLFIKSTDHILIIMSLLLVFSTRLDLKIKKIFRQDI